MNEDQVTRTGVVPWDTVTDDKGRRAFTAGRLRAAIAGLDDDAPVVLHIATDEDDVADDQIVVDAGHGSIGLGRWLRPGARPDLRAGVRMAHGPDPARPARPTAPLVSGRPRPPKDAPALGR